MNALLDSLASGFHGSAEQRTVLDAALGNGLPGARNEAWKYTSLRALERRTFAVAEAVGDAIDPALLAEIPSPRLVFVNGCFDPARSDVAGLPAGIVLEARLPGSSAGPSGAAMQGEPMGAEAVFARLADALAVQGVALRVEAGAQVAMPVHLVFVGHPAQRDVAWHLTHAFDVGAGATVSIVEHHIASGDHAHLGNASMQVRIGEGATLLHARVQDEAERATVICATHATLARDAHYQRVDFELGAALSRHDLVVTLAGDGARLSANGVLLATGRRHVDTRLDVAHRARDTTCDLAWRGLGAGRGRAVFRGGIVIHQGADGADARLSNKNLLLGENAEIDTQPVLEIHADEVKAAHGATVGQLDPTALFYLRSRGLPEDAARRLLTAAFCREIAESASSPGIRDALTQSLERALARMDVA